jgi:pimeloyl-ACP methyl ester carboxylesterase
LSKLALLVCALLLAGCGAALESLQEGRDLLDGLARRNGWSRVEHAGEGFSFVGYQRIAPGAQDLVVYIEGDGASRLDRQLPADPTPLEPDSFRLVLTDPAPSKLYLGRPCQFLSADQLARCSPAYWSLRRHAPEVVAALSAAIDQAKAAAGARRIILHGKSGGGVAAALIAARRDDVAFLMTAAAYLDVARWTETLGVTPLSGSLDPATLVASLARVPQVHLVGGRDRIVPPTVAQSYAARFPSGAPVAIVTIGGFDHDCCWRRQWPALLAQHRRPP